MKKQSSIMNKSIYISVFLQAFRLKKDQDVHFTTSIVDRQGEI